MGIGGALAQARNAAGLTTAQVSERTRIRETIIRDIERDDYSACGGDYYARGHIRAIARVVGADPVPLIKEYDAVHMPPPEPAEPEDQGDGPAWRFPGWQRIAGSAAGASDVDPRTQGGNAHRAHAAAGDDSDTNPEPYDPGILGFRTTRPTSPGVPGGITAAEAFRPRMPLEPPRVVPRRVVALAVALLAAIGVLIYLLVSGGPAPSPALTGHHTRAHHPTGSGVTAHRTGNSATPSTSATPLASAVPLAPASAAAFGPSGPGAGDDPQQASLAIDGNDSTAWRTDWYATANFGGLQSGTGLLLNLGKRVSVSSVRIQLDAAAGGRLELRAGNTSVLADLPVVARAHVPGGPITVPIGSPVRARYLLIWFTRLPLDSSGTYRASISNVTLSGTA